MTREEWIEAFARALGVPPPSAEQIEEILALAGTAAHSSERSAAPLATWLAGASGRPPGELNELARQIAEPS